jgi:hypothetical protein
MLGKRRIKFATLADYQGSESRGVKLPVSLQSRCYSYSYSGLCSGSFCGLLLAYGTILLYFPRNGLLPGGDRYLLTLRWSDR